MTDAAPDPARPLCIRWTIGDVSPAGFEALALSVHGARRLFGGHARYVVCLNTLSLDEARRRAGPLPGWLEWHAVGGGLPGWLRPFVDEGMSEGTAWKLVPPRLVEGADELALDNDVVLWDLPRALCQWLAGGCRQPVVAADVVHAVGQFGAFCAQPRNSGIRGVPAGFDFAGAMAAVLAEHPVRLTSELDEQGLQIAALTRGTGALVVTTDEVSICSPFPPHQPGLGTCGAHFVGLNSRTIPWEFYGRPAIEVRLEHWRRLRPEVGARVGLPLSGAGPAVAAAVRP